MPLITNLADAVQRANDLMDGDTRVLLGITGPPGAGKSTLSQQLKTAYADSVQVVEMDGFHLSKERMEKLGLEDRMGAIETFDAAGFVALVRRVRNDGGTSVYAPKFRRDMGASIAGAVVIEASAKLVIVEGNYLLVREKPWDELRSLLNEIWYCDRDEDSRIESLISRRKQFGQSDTEARAWAWGSDQRNAQIVAETRSRADAIVALDFGEVKDPNIEKTA